MPKRRRAARQSGSQAGDISHRDPHHHQLLHDSDAGDDIRDGGPRKRARGSKSGNVLSQAAWKPVDVDSSFFLGNSEPGFLSLEVIEGPEADAMLLDPHRASSDDIDARDAGDAGEDAEAAKPQQPQGQQKRADKKRRRKQRKRRRVQQVQDNSAQSAGDDKVVIANADNDADISDDAGKDDSDVNDGDNYDSDSDNPNPNPNVNDDVAAAEGDEDEEDEEQAVVTDTQQWEQFGLHQALLMALGRLGFSTPTPIQLETLPIALAAGCDVVGAAQTGSGKTLAFGLPIAHGILTHGKVDSFAPVYRCRKQASHALQALVFAPTRELAMQVQQHLEAILAYTPVRAVAVVGGVSRQKQERVLSYRPHILVATPGRVWDLMTHGHEYLNDLHDVRFLVIDEADRMVETGHFRELELLLAALPSRSKRVDQFDQAPEDPRLEQDVEHAIRRVAVKRQTFVFSATMSLPIRERFLGRRGRGKTKNKDAASAPVDRIMDRIDFMRRVRIVEVTPSIASPVLLTAAVSDAPAADATPSTRVAERVHQAAIMCSATDKDLYLLYLLYTYPGRTLVFTNTADCLRHIVPLLQHLQLPVYPLHAGMQQRQRLKNLDRFRAQDSAVLVATDVAARGLDIPGIQHVVHYQVPRSSDAYVHRSGRTARAHSHGVSIVLVAANEATLYRRLMAAINLDGRTALPLFPVDVLALPPIRRRLQAARAVDTLVHAASKQRAASDWKQRAAAAADICLSSDDEADDDSRGGGDGDGPSARNRRKADQQLAAAKAELAGLLAKPLMRGGVSQRYITRDLQSVLASVGDAAAQGKSSALQDLAVESSSRPQQKRIARLANKALRGRGRGNPKSGVGSIGSVPKHRKSGKAAAKQRRR